MKRKFSIILLVVFILIMSMLVVDASALSFTTTMQPNKTNIDAATELTVNVKVSNLNVGDNGINTFTAYLAYDTDVFETLSDSSVEGLNGWVVAYEPGTGKVTLNKSSFVNEDQEIMQITLKTKSGVSDNTKGEISLSNIVASNSETEITATNVSTEITVGTESTQIIKEPEPEPENTPTPIVTNEDTEKNENVNVVPQEPKADIPYTGTDSEALVKIIVGVILIALATYIKIEKMKDVK